MPNDATGTARIGISGWRYRPWRGQFYPPKLKQKCELAYASSIFRSLEINGTFYSLQRPEYFAAWASETPDDFIFSVKGPKFITHFRRLKEAKVPLANFMASGLLRLGSKLGPILWQLPPNFRFDPKVLESFFKLLPRDTESAAALAKRHDKYVTGRCALKASADCPLRHALEIRHESFVTPDFVALLRANDIALVCADSVEWPRLMDTTSDFVYCRLHGSKELYVSGYDDEALSEWADRVVRWIRGLAPAAADTIIEREDLRLRAHDVYIYFDNDAKVRAPFDAQRLVGMVNKLLEVPDASSEIKEHSGMPR